jgi:hypothetical protein
MSYFLIQDEQTQIAVIKTGRGVDARLQRAIEEHYCEKMLAISYSYNERNGHDGTEMHVLMQADGETYKKVLTANKIQLYK